MTSTQLKLTISAAVICATVLCGCGKVDQPKSEPPNPVPVKWTDPALRLSPFTMVRFDGDKVTVTYVGADFELVSINGLSTSEMVGFCRSEYQERWQKRFAEDLVAVLSDMGHPLEGAHTVSLALVDSKSGEKKTIERANMTAENRQAVHAALSASPEPN